MQDRYSESKLRVTIASQKIKDRTYYYSLAKKNQQTLSFLTNQRLLILDFQQGRLFYGNQTKNLPFKVQGPEPKKQFAKIKITKIQYTPKTNLISFFFKHVSDPCQWNFEFQTVELAAEWIELIQFQKTNTELKDKEIKALNKGILQMPKMQKQYANDIVKEPQRRIADDESRIIKEKSQSVTPKSVNQNNSFRHQPPSDRSAYIDWNHQFYNERNIMTLYLFEKAAIQCFFKTINKQVFPQNKLHLYENESFTIKIAHRYTLSAKKLKNQFRNYHFILDATNKQFIIGVPLTCLIEFQHIVCFVKAKFPQKVSAVAYDNNLKEQLCQLQRYTRIKNRVLQFGTILDLSKHYSTSRGPSILYLDNLEEYLPVNLEFPNQLTLIRPEYLLDNVDFLILNGPTQKISKTQNRSLRQLSFLTINKAAQFSNTFFLDFFQVVRASELKNIFHDHGLNLKFLASVYNQCNNYYVKKYIYTTMTAKIIKDHVYESILRIKVKDDGVNLVKLIEEILMVIIEGNNNKSHELWKEISLIFKRKYSIVLNHKEIIPGFFLNSIMQLIPAQYDISKINKNKKIFQEVKIINPGFITSLAPKVKSYTRFLPEHLEKLKLEAKEYTKSEELSDRILNELFNQKSKKYEGFYDFGQNTQWMIEYLSLYYPPENLTNEKDDKIIKNLFDRINQEPPSYFSLNLTNNYLIWCNKKENTQAFKAVFQKAIGIADYWLEQIHPMRSELLESLSEYYAILGSHDDTIKYMKLSLTIYIKFWGGNSSQVGLKHYELADKYLRAGKKAEAIEHFTKAKENIELNKTKTNKYGLSLMKLASIYLSNLQYDKATELAKASIKGFQDHQKKINSSGIYNEPFKIKAYQILARIFEISNLRTEYKQLALTCARKFNTTKSKEVFEQMVRICLASCIFKSNNDRCRSFLNLVRVQSERNLDNAPNAQESIANMMLYSEDCIVMQKFMLRFQHFQRSLFELNSKKRQLSEENRQFIEVLRSIMMIVGSEYIIGLIDQKTSCFAQ